jgi:hypothetical protein
VAGRESGHRPGLFHALSGLPLSPLLPGCGDPGTARRAAGPRHAGALPPAAVPAHLPESDPQPVRVDNPLLRLPGRGGVPPVRAAGKERAT